MPDFLSQGLSPTAVATNKFKPLKLARMSIFTNIPPQRVRRVSKSSCFFSKPPLKVTTLPIAEGAKSPRRLELLGASVEYLGQPLNRP